MHANQIFTSAYLRVYIFVYMCANKQVSMTNTEKQGN